MSGYYYDAINTWNTGWKGWFGEVNIGFEMLMGDIQEKISGTWGRRYEFWSPERGRIDHRCRNDDF